MTDPIVEPVVEPGSQQEPPVVDPVAETPKPYTDEEIAALTPTSDIDLERVPASVRPVIENMTRDYKELQKGYSQKVQEAAELRKAVPAEPETYFDDQKKDGVFKDYLKNPLKIIGDINTEIANLEAVIPEDGAEEYRKARRQIAYWNGVKDEFQVKRIEVSERNRAAEVEEVKFTGELGEKAQAIVDFAESIGVSKKDLRSNAKLRNYVKTQYEAAHAGESARKKEVKPGPHKAAAPAGQDGPDAKTEPDTSKMSDAEWFKYEQDQRLQKLKKKFGG